MSRCSIIIINHNDYENLVKTVKSVRKQEYSDKEIIVVDNNSSDKSKDFLEQQSDLKTINCKKNLGVSKAKNLGVSKCTGKYILFLDSDILFIDKKTIKEVIKIYKKNKPAIISLLTKNKNESKTKLYGVFLNFFYSEINKKIEFKKIQDFKDNYPVSCPHAAFMFTEKKVYKKLGGFDESQKFNVDDTDIGPRAWINGISCILKTKPHLIHLGKNKRKNIQNFCWKFKFFFSGFGRVILKNYKFRNVLICFPLFFIFVFLKTLKQALYRRSFLPIYSFIRSIYIFLSNLSDTIKKRKEVQSKRKIEKDIFLDIENPF